MSKSQALTNSTYELIVNIWTQWENLNEKSKYTELNRQLTADVQVAGSHELFHM